jgi:elongation factor 1-beta
MTRIILVAKILPTGTEINLDDIISSIKESLKDGIELKRFEKEPLAFGLEFIKAQFTLDDAGGQMQSLEDSVKSVQGVSEFEVLNMSRMSVDMK